VHGRLGSWWRPEGEVKDLDTDTAGGWLTRTWDTDAVADGRQGRGHGHSRLAARKDRDTDAAGGQPTGTEDKRGETTNML